MELCVVSPNVRFTTLTVPPGSTVSDLIDHFAVKEGGSSADFYVKSNGRVSRRSDPLRAGVVYRVEPRLCGGKGGMQASSSGLVKADEGPSRKRPTPASSEKKAKKKCFWTGLGGLEEMGSSGEGSDDSDSEASPSTSGASRSSDVPKPAVPPSATRGSDRTDPQEQQPSSSSSSSSQSPAPSSPTQVEEEVQKECTAETSQNATSEEDKSSQNPTLSSPTQVEEEVQKECTAETNQNSSIEEDKSSQCPASSSPTQVEEEVQKEYTAETSRTSSIDEDKAQVDPTEAPSGPAGSSQAQEEVEGLLDLLSVSGPEQLEALGLERLKKELMERGMKCGGTLQERAARLFSIKGLSPDQIDPALLAKPTKGKKK
ncbi:hypothetical protein cypCar_00028668 [Cyprinus carpio]|nr:hypothetical protein cypCar_00028668 [Cyprinus carpio]